MSENAMTQEMINVLIQQAIRVRQNSYAPYSGYHVGAALLSEDGMIYTGVNVENASYPAGICAERTAFCKAVSEGQRVFQAIAIVGGKSDEPVGEYCLPCGICRQFMSELCGNDFQVIAARSTEDYQVFRLEELLPNAFYLKKN